MSPGDVAAISAGIEVAMWTGLMFGFLLGGGVAFLVCWFVDALDDLRADEVERRLGD